MSQIIFKINGEINYLLSGGFYYLNLKLNL